MIFNKILECSCVNGFTGDFCEFKIEQDTLLFAHDSSQFVFATNGRLIQDYTAIDDSGIISGSCSTMLNGEAIIFGGDSIICTTGECIILVRQVHLKINRQRMDISLILDNGGC